VVSKSLRLHTNHGTQETGWRWLSVQVGEESLCASRALKLDHVRIAAVYVVRSSKQPSLGRDEMCVQSSLCSISIFRGSEIRFVC
jgi:hypothetical protein